MLVTASGYASQRPTSCAPRRKIGRADGQCAIETTSRGTRGVARSACHAANPTTPQADDQAHTVAVVTDGTACSVWGTCRRRAARDGGQRPRCSEVRRRDAWRYASHKGPEEIISIARRAPVKAA